MVYKKYNLDTSILLKYVGDVPVLYGHPVLWIIGDGISFQWRQCVAWDLVALSVTFPILELATFAVCQLKSTGTGSDTAHCRWYPGGGAVLILTNMFNTAYYTTSQCAKYKGGQNELGNLLRPTFIIIQKGNHRNGLPQTTKSRHG